MAMDFYINRVDEGPCGETCIHLCKGADSSDTSPSGEAPKWGNLGLSRMATLRLATAHKKK